MFLFTRFTPWRGRWTSYGDGLDAGNPSNDEKDTEDTKILNHRALVHVLHIFLTHMLEVDASRTSAEIQMK